TNALGSSARGSQWSAPAAYQPRAEGFDRIVVALALELACNRGDDLVGIILRRSLTKLALHLGDEVWRGDRIAGSDLVDLDHDEAAAIGQRSDAALSRRQREQYLQRRRDRTLRGRDLEPAGID